ncbi:MAG: putative toxin-antitoxin system toxin component, PIN family [Thermosynechococcaceae cyanobacterium MS004]|nr:putative toxin-antitoxin system toxin component, PIN family [Thermosynechococcaceae cyanobacterium MS004]
MKPKARYVFDSNVIISALLFESSKPARAFRYALQHGEILLSLELLEELNEVLSRKKFSRYITSHEREAFLETFVAVAVLVDLVTPVQACRDPKDDPILGLALDGDAAYIISGDADLLVLSPFQNVKIITAETFLSMVTDTNFTS